jgi:hypothetical protein
MIRLPIILAVALYLTAPCWSAEQDASLRREAAEAMRKSSEYFRGQVATEGGRLYMTSLAVCALEVYYRHLPPYRQEVLDEF